MHLVTSAYRIVWNQLTSAKLSPAFCFLVASAFFATGATGQTLPAVDCTTGVPWFPTPGHPNSTPRIPHNTTNPGNEYFCTITTTLHPDGSEDIEIQQPVVDQPTFTYNPIKLKPGDQITVTADGCVQRAGYQQTWERYVNPESSGPPFLGVAISISKTTSAP